MSDSHHVGIPVISCESDDMVRDLEDFLNSNRR